MSKTQHYFLSSVRQGLASAIVSSGDTLGQRAEINVELQAQRRIKGSGTQETIPLSQNVQLYGPGDILGFDTRIITRKVPQRDVGDFEPNYFPHIEFADPDFIWRYTADKAEQSVDNEPASGDLKPWLSLVVLICEALGDDIQPEFIEGERSEDTLPRHIVVNDAASLPDLSFSKHWAHVHLTHKELSGNQEELKNKLGEVLKNEPERAVCRLLCTRRLQPKVKYTAFLVPSFKLGLLAGLGQSFTEDVNALTPAWSGTETDFKLPYYYRWDFRTGLRGDFEHLVRLLEPRKLNEMGTRDVDCSRPGFNLPGIERPEFKDDDPENPDPQKNVLGMEGSLQSLDTQYTVWGRDLDIQIPDKGIIQDVKVLRQSRNTIEVAWRTTEPAKSRVDYGDSDAYGNHVTEDSFKIEHRLSVNDLVESETYYIRVLAQPNTGDNSVTEDKTFELPLQDEFQKELADLLNKPNTEDMTVRNFEFNSEESTEITEITGTAIPTGDKIKISWQTINDSRARIEYGRDNKYDQLIELTVPMNNPVLTLPKLIPGKTYQFKIIVLNDDDTMLDRAEGDFTMPPLPTVLPPVYGRWHRGQLKDEDADGHKNIVDANAQHEWLDALNLDPRHRLAAGLGAEVIRTHQEPLMASAWEQLGEMEKINGILRNAQLGRDASASLHNKLSELDSEDYLRITASTQKKVIRELDDNKPGDKVTTDIFLHSQSRVPRAVLDPAFRRVSGPKNSISKRQNRNRTDVIQRKIARSLAKENGLEPAGNVRPGLGMPQFKTINRRLERAFSTSVASSRQLIRSFSASQTQDELKIDFNKEFFNNRDVRQYVQRYSPLNGDEFELADSQAQLVGNTINSWLLKKTTRVELPVYKDEDGDTGVDNFLKNFTSKLADDISPLRTIMERSKSKLHNVGRIAQRFEIDEEDEIDDDADIISKGDALDPVDWAPEFPQAMYEVLRDKSHDMLLPGVEKIPQNTLGLLKTNRRFVESYFCGLNHEFSRELLWRGYPTDLRGSSFRQFWDVENYVPRPVELETLWNNWKNEKSLASADDLSVRDKQLIFMRDIDKNIELLVKELSVEQPKAIAILRGDGYIDYRLQALSGFEVSFVDVAIEKVVTNIEGLPFEVKQQIFKRNIYDAADKLENKVNLDDDVIKTAIEELQSDKVIDERIKALLRLEEKEIDKIDEVILEFAADLTKLQLDDKKLVFRLKMESAAKELQSILLQENEVNTIAELPVKKRQVIRTLRGDDRMQYRIKGLADLLNESDQSIVNAVNQVINDISVPLDVIPYQEKIMVVVEDMDFAIELLQLNLPKVESSDSLVLLDEHNQAIKNLQEDRIEALTQLPIEVINAVVKEFATEQALKEKLADIKPLTQWQDSILGENRNGPVERLVLVIRGDLLKRYPNAAIYAIDGVSKNCAGGEKTVPAMAEYKVLMECDNDAANAILADKKRIFPVFSANLQPDITLLGFPFDREAACGCDGDPGKYFVIEEQVSEPRFGLDVPTDPPAELPVGEAEWSDDLSWSHFGFGTNDENFHYGDYLDALRDNSQLPEEPENKKAEWNKASAAKRAWHTWQKPVRIAIHASQMIPQDIDPSN